MRNDCPVCHKGDMMFVEVIEYGADADGNRGVPMSVFGCSECGYEELWDGKVREYGEVAR